MVKTQYQYVVKTPGYRGGKARVKGISLTVASIVFLRNTGSTIDEIVAAYAPNLPKAEVEEALEYYLNNKEEIDNDIESLSRPPEGYKIGPNGILYKK